MGTDMIKHQKIVYPGDSDLRLAALSESIRISMSGAGAEQIVKEAKVMFDFLKDGTLPKAKKARK
jgi:hypothetical protein